jgi:hypothetical protein
MSTRDPRMAFRCNSGCFGDMVTPVAQVVRSVEWSDEHQQWICRVGGPGDPVLYCREKHVLESMLDDLENRNALNKTEDVLCHEKAIRNTRAAG